MATASTTAPTIRLKDYKPFPCRIPSIALDVVIGSDSVEVSSRMELTPVLGSEPQSLELQGVDLLLQSIAIDHHELKPSDYSITSEKLIIHQPPQVPFQLKTVCRIDPQANTSLEGLYASGGMLTTQCEAEGFRRITYHPDRPDVLSRFTVRIEADRERYPVLLSNGNALSAGPLAGDPTRHEVTWEDPSLKPSYLFALVAGDLHEVRDQFVTLSGRNVSLRLHVEPGDEPFTAHAMESLKRSMAWDEQVYGLEYDLDEFNTVAVRHFNMGAMENKSLNIFNSKLVLADAETASDAELERIESVVAHEYFHNWSGNRITCRDWFQLSLKEGLTVFRDQCFTADLHSEALKRIEDAAMLRNTQFREDAGPTAHPVKPDAYQAIDNFYTTTIYEKGAELIRMLRTLLGETRFMRGMALYFKRHDGEAATTDDFVAAIAEGACLEGEPLGFDLNQFKRWYEQAGYSHGDGEAHLGFHQRGVAPELASKHASNTGAAAEAALGDSLAMDRGPSQWGAWEEQLLVFDQEEHTLELKGLPCSEQPPALSLFRQFSAPVHWEASQEPAELFTLLACDNDPFARWDAGQQLWRRLLLARASGSPNADLEGQMLEALTKLLAPDGEQDSAVLSTLMAFPGGPELEALQQEADPPALYRAACELREQFGQSLAPLLRERLNGVAPDLALAWPEGQGQRQLTGLVWAWLAAAGDSAVRKAALAAVGGPSMTLARAALRALQPLDCPEREEALRQFHDRWQEKPVIFDSWFALEASTPRADGLQRVASLLQHPRFDPMAPNAVRAVLGGFAGNLLVFHAEDGSGYRFMAEQIIALDQRNAITASRLAKVFSRWGTYSSKRQALVKAVLDQLSAARLSPNTREVVEMMLG